MSGKKKVLVPLDGSTFAEHAIPLAAAIAQRNEHDLQLLSVYADEPVVAGWSLSADRLAASLRTYLDRVAGKAGGPVSTNVVGGDVSDVLIKEAGRWNVDLIVMATHGRGGLHRGWLGSVADDVVRHATVPVLLVRPFEDETEPTGTPQLEDVLIALDGSKRAERGIDAAVRIGGSEAVYTLLRVVPGPLFAPSSYPPDAIREEADQLAAGRGEAATYLETAAKRVVERGFQVRTDVVTGVPAATGILRYADQHPADLIVVTTHGRGGLRRALLGSVADKVVRGAGLPVLVTRAT